MNEERKLTLQEIHKFTLNNLKKIIEICDKLSINYFIAYGTLIGAARHEGFIPWDDDFDIMMLRPDYDKFCKYCIDNKAELKQYKLVNRETDRQYPYNISRFCDTRFRMKRSDNVPVVEMGVFIDIYPLDGVGYNRGMKSKILKMRKKVNMILWDFSLTNQYIAVNSNIILSIAKAPIVLYTHFRKMQYFLNKLDDLRKLYSYEKSEYVDCVVWGEISYPLKKELFLKYVFLDFEGIQVKVPIHWEQILTTIYGDYMKLPPIEKRVSSHDYELYYKYDDN